MKVSISLHRSRASRPSVVPSIFEHDTIPSLDGLRALSVLIVLTAHAGYGHLIPGGLGVTIFFFLSGYLITTLMLREHERTGTISIRDFYIRRVFRLLPPLLVTLTIAYALTFAGLLTGGISIKGLLAQILYFANYYAIFFDAGNTVPDGSGILWSLAVEEHFYIFYPAAVLLLMAARRHAGSMATVFIVCCIGVLVWRLNLALQPDFKPERTYYATDTRIDSILYGCILALRFNPLRNGPVSPGTRDTSSSMSNSDWALFLGGALTLLVTLLVRDPLFRETVRYSLQGLALMPIFYYSIRHAANFPFTMLNNKYMAKIGVYSYSIYLIHHICIKAIETNFPSLTASQPVLVLATLAISILYAAAIDTYIDPYFRALRRRFRPAGNWTSAIR